MVGGPWSPGGLQNLRGDSPPSAPGQRLPRHPSLSRWHPPLSLHSASHRGFGFQAKAPVPIQHWAPPGHRTAGAFRGLRPASATEAPNAAPLWPPRSAAVRAPPASGWDARAGSCSPLARGLMWPPFWGLALLGPRAMARGVGEGYVRLAGFLALRHARGVGDELWAAEIIQGKENVFSGL